MPVRDQQPVSPIRLALVITELRPGGAERCLAKIALGLSCEQFEPQIYVLAPPPPPNESQLVEALQQGQVPVHFIGARSKTQLFGAVKKLRKLVEQQSPHVVQSFLFHANVVSAMATRRMKMPVLAGLRVAQPKVWRQFVERRLARHFAGFVCVSRAVAEPAVHQGRLSREKMHVVPNGVDVANWKDVALIDWTTLHISPQQRVILFVGRLDVQKGADLLIDAAAQLLPHWPQHDIVLIGDGPERASLISSVKRCELQSRIHFVPWQADVARCIAAAELVVLPSRYEGMSNVLLEAMAAGKPVVATNVEGVAEVLGPLAERQTCTANDAGALASAIVNLLRDDDAREQLGAANRARVAEHFSLQRMIDAYAALYLETVANHRAMQRP